MRAQAQLLTEQPSVVLPTELERVLRDYERAWRAGAPSWKRRIAVRAAADQGKFLLTLRRARGVRWLIFSDMDNGCQPPAGSSWASHHLTPVLPGRFAARARVRPRYPWPG